MHLSDGHKGPFYLKLPLGVLGIRNADDLIVTKVREALQTIKEGDTTGPPLYDEYPCGKLDKRDEGRRRPTLKCQRVKVAMTMAVVVRPLPS